MSSHREAPEIAKDPVADSTDVYAFVSPDKPGTVTLIANYIPLQSPAGGPNFYEFGDDVLYEIHVDNNGDGRADVSFQFRFRTTVRNPETFLYNTGPIQSLDSPNWNRRQSYDVSMSGADHRHRAGLPAVQHRPAVHAGLHRAGRPGGASAGRRDHGVRRAAGRGLLRRPGRHIRPGRPAAVRAAARHVRPAGPQGGTRGQRHRQRERALDRDPGAGLRADAERPSDHRGVDHGEPPAGPAVGRRPAARTWTAARSGRCRGSATRWSTRS